MHAPRPNLDMDVLRTFVTGIELGSFAKAAERLARSPSTISAQLKKLEAQIGVPLLHKAGRGLALTEAGEALLAYARRLLDLHDEAVAAVRDVTVAGWVRLGVQEDFAEGLLPPVLGRFARTYANVRIEVRVARNADLLERVIRGQLDLALLWGVHDAVPYGEQLAEVPMVWIGPAAHRPVIGDLDQQLPLVVFEAPCLFRSAGTTALDTRGLAWRIVFTSPSLAGLWAATAAGLGVTIRTPIGIPAGVRILDAPAAG